MNESLAALAEALDVVRRTCGDRSPEALAPGELMAVNEAFGALRRRVDAAYLPVAAEINRQSRPELGKDSFAKKQGFRSSATLISATTGTSVGEAQRTVAVGEATAPRTTFTGEARPPKHPHVAAAVTAGSIGVPASSAIITMLDRVALRADPGALNQMERTLADAAAGPTLDQLQKLVQRAEAYLDPDGLEPRESELYGDRSLTLREDRTGAMSSPGSSIPSWGRRSRCRSKAW